MKIPVLYRKIVSSLNGFNKEELTLKEFEKALLNFRLSKKDCLKIIKELDGLDIVEFKGLNNQYAKIKVKKILKL